MLKLCYNCFGMLIQIKCFFLTIKFRLSTVVVSFIMLKNNTINLAIV
jgi:hypothetical protein